MNRLYLGDSFEILREWIPDESIDLIYIDPPFNSRRNYNIFFDNREIRTHRVAFEDTWSLKNVRDSLNDLQSLQTEKLYKLLMVYSEVAPFAFPYLVMMGLRIVELHRVLKPTGSFYLHCDPNMSHYLKTICDLIFGGDHFRNEIIWCYEIGGRSKKHWAKKHDVILFYSKSDQFCFNRKEVSLPRKSGTHMKTCTDDAERKYQEKTDAKSGKIYRYYIDEGTIPPDWWQGIQQLNRIQAERLGYPTQKPKALLERIIKASSNKGDVVLDAFCGCGTTVDTAEGLDRKWIGMDISPIAVALIQKRLKETYGKVLSAYEVRGIPRDEKSAIQLWQQNPFAFQDWWITEFGAFSTTFGKKGADKGIDGIAKYLTDGDNTTLKVAFQVKGGKVQSKDTDALRGAMLKLDCQMGVFLTIEEPAKPMQETVAKSGVVSVPGYNYPKLQILTLAEFFANKSLKLPQTNITFESAKLRGKGHHQLRLG